VLVVGAEQVDANHVPREHVQCDRGEGSDRGVARGDHTEQQPQRLPTSLIAGDCGWRKAHPATWRGLPRFRIAWKARMRQAAPTKTAEATDDPQTRLAAHVPDG
jgi:hypothetical protein